MKAIQRGKRWAVIGQGYDYSFAEIVGKWRTYFEARGPDGAAMKVRCDQVAQRFWSREEAEGAVAKIRAAKSLHQERCRLVHEKMDALYREFDHVSADTKAAMDEALGRSVPARSMRAPQRTRDEPVG